MEGSIVTVKSVTETAANVAILVLVAFAGWVYFHPRTPPNPNEPPKPPTEIVSLDGAAVQGSDSAKVAMVVFSDFECPFCSRLASALDETSERYVKTGNVLLAFRHMPIESIHKHAMPAAKASVCAGRQGHFWSVHDAFFKKPDIFKTEWQEGFAERSGLDPAMFAACLSDPRTEAGIRRDIEMATKFGIKSTPTTFVGMRVGNGVKVSKVLRGAMLSADIARVLDAFLK